MVRVANPSVTADREVRALLVLSGGVVFEGRNFGAEGETIGEVVFNTSMTGYQEILSDPSYKGQIVTMTYTQMGNYGINSEDAESRGGPKAEGFVVKEYIDFPSNWRSGYTLGQYLREHGIVGIEGIDTRALTKHLRDHGAQMGIISTVDLNPGSLLEKARAHPGIGGLDLVREVTSKKAYKWEQPVWKWGGEVPAKGKGAPRVVVYDFGVKLNILRNLVSAGFEVAVVPASTPAEEVLDMNPDGIVLSNGPGNPEAVAYAIENAKKLIAKKPVFGICLGHQILGLALRGRTYKLKFGHHGGNHPVMDIKTGRVEITSQNHNYCVDIGSLNGKVRLTHKNLYDGTEEGMEHVELPVFSVQHHPEAGPGPNDSTHIFARFMEMIGGGSRIVYRGRGAG
ncbi:MAG: glutamine-hydrolyzing carbamoyl-phosphate synthase small subunit [Thermodesulfovibrionales bacterium]|nr:glutamine-hydrolyzing carbamoyl-phosphate synthase small subunit [Thermodesulfovibrionales bacterium]